MNNPPLNPGWAAGLAVAPAALPVDAGGSPAPAHSEPASPVDLIVIGGGLTGLTAAFEATRAGLRVALLEAAPRCGGVIASVQRDGWLYERGPNSAFDGHPAVAELVAALGLQGAQCWALPQAARRYVVHQGQLQALPSSAWGLLRTPLFSASAKLGLLAAPLRRPQPPGVEESMAGFTRRRLGEEFLARLVDPFVGGILAGDPEQVSLAAIAPGLQAMEARWSGWQRGRWRPPAVSEAPGLAPLHPPAGSSDQPAVRPRPRRQSFSFSGGLQQLTDTLAAHAGQVRCDTAATGFVRGEDGQYTVTTTTGPSGRLLRWQAPQLMLAVPAPAAARLLRPHLSAAADALDGIAYAPVATVASAYRQQDLAHPLDGFGCLMAAGEPREALGVLFCSSTFAGRAPPGMALLSTFFGGTRQPQTAARTDSDLLAQAHAEHRALLGATAAPLWQTVTRWPQAVAQYTRGHLGRVAQAEAAATKLPGLHLCGSWKGGVSLGDCLRQGGQAGRAAAAWAAVAQARTGRRG